MCLISIRWDPSLSPSLILASNRDEYISRDTAKLDFHWEGILGGRDLQSGGTWLACSSKGFAAVTNYHEKDKDRTRKFLFSRGKIPIDFLESSDSAEVFANNLFRKCAEDCSAYDGFNAILFDGSSLVYCTNRCQGKGVRVLVPGVYGLSNHLLDTPWPKVTSVKEAMNASKACTHDELVDGILSLFHKRRGVINKDEVSYAELAEELVQAIFVQLPGYQTRTSTLVNLDGNVWNMTEQTHEGDSFEGKHMQCSLGKCKK